MTDKGNNQRQTSSVSSIKTNKTYVFRLNTLLVGGVVLILLIISFYGGVLYGSSQQQSFVPSLNKAEHKFAIGLVVYTNTHSITINNENTKTTQKYFITNKTTISINGSPAKVNQIKPGNIVLIRVTRGKPFTAGVIIVNSKFTD
jgi:ribosomal protein S17